MVPSANGHVGISQEVTRCQVTKIEKKDMKVRRATLGATKKRAKIPSPRASE
jgi:hypothetical protein